LSQSDPFELRREILPELPGHAAPFLVCARHTELSFLNE